MLILAAGMVAGCVSSPSASPTGADPNATLPAMVAGMPVRTVAAAVDLVQSGAIEGKAVAVAGYYDTFSPSCPYPGRYIGPLETWCSFVALADTAADAQLCSPMGGNGITCHQPTGAHLVPFFLAETAGNPWSLLSGAAAGVPAAVVLIGHVGDPRQWQCTAETHDACAKAFVVDRLAWAAGQDVPLDARETGDQQSGRPITPRMTLPEVAAVVGPSETLLAGAAFQAGVIATVDPRWNLAGDTIVWLVRSIAPTASSNPGDPRPETVWLIDDTTGKVIDSQPLISDPGFRPARLWSVATVRGLECCAGDVGPFVSVESADGSVLYEGRVPGGASGDADSTVFGGGYGSLPLVLPAGRYRVSAWLATVANGAPSQTCSTELTLAQLDEVALDAQFPAGQPCSFDRGPLPSPAF
jgi:hypothetical protein